MITSADRTSASVSEFLICPPSPPPLQLNPSVRREREGGEKKIGFRAVSHFKRARRERSKEVQVETQRGWGRWRGGTVGWLGAGEAGGCKVGMYLKARQRDQEEKETNSVCPCVFVCVRLCARAIRLLVAGSRPTTDPSQKEINKRISWLKTHHL